MMTLNNFFLTIIVTFLLAGSQVWIKLGIEKLNGINIGFKTLFIDIIPYIGSIYLWLGAIFTLIGALLWMKVLSEVKLSIAYPMISISYVFGLLAAKYIFSEDIPTIRWVGVVVLMIGLYLISKG